MTYEEAVKSGLPFNRSKYKDGYYRFDPDRGVYVHYRDLSQRMPEFSEEDKQATDWVVDNVTPYWRHFYG